MRPGYKQTEVGVIPEDWTVVSLGDLFVFKNGLNKAKEFFGSGTPIINYMDVFQNPGLRQSQVHGKVNVSQNEQNAYGVKKGDMFFTRTSETVNEIGYASVLLEDIESGVFSGFVLRARPKKDILDLLFKKYCFSSNIVRKQITSTSSYTTRALTNGRLLSQIVLPYPPKREEQQAITAVLSDIDNLLAALDRLIAKKRAVKTGAMQQLLTGEVRVGEGNGRWETVNIGACCQPRKERISPDKLDDSVYCIELEHIEQGTGSIIGRIQANKQVSLKTVFYPGDVLFGKLRAYLRKFWLSGEKGVCSTEIWALVAEQSLILPSYLYQIVTTDGFIETASEAYGTHMPRADWNVVKNFEFQLPPLPEQRAIAAILSDMDAEIAALETRRAKTHALKQGMMQELLTGRTRLVEVEKGVGYGERETVSM
jgi:type I restriction enzyme, S subunit